MPPCRACGLVRLRLGGPYPPYPRLSVTGIGLMEGTPGIAFGMVTSLTAAVVRLVLMTPLLIMVHPPLPEPPSSPVEVAVESLTRTRGTLSVTTTRERRQERRSSGSSAVRVRLRPDAPTHAPVAVGSVVVMVMAIRDAMTTGVWVTAVATGEVRGVASTAPARRVGRVIGRVTAGVPVDVTL